MKKIIYLLLMIFSLVALTSCTDGLDNPNLEDIAGLENVEFNNLTVDYDGKEHSIEVKNLPEGYSVEYTGNNVSEVGVHTVTVKIFDADKKLVITLTATITVNDPIQSEIPEELKNVVLKDINVDYDGKEHSIYVENLPEGYTVSYAGNKVSEVGSHTVTAKIYNSDFENVLTLTAEINILGIVVPEELKDVTFDGISVPHDGKEHSITVKNLPEGFTVSYSGNKVSEVGTYTVTAKIYNSDFENVLTLTATINIVGKNNDNSSSDVELPLV